MTKQASSGGAFLRKVNTKSPIFARRCRVELQTTFFQKLLHQPQSNSQVWWYPAWRSTPLRKWVYNPPSQAATTGLCCRTWWRDISDTETECIHGKSSPAQFKSAPTSVSAPRNRICLSPPGRIALQRERKRGETAHLSGPRPRHLVHIRWVFRSRRVPGIRAKVV
ncbi:uncharacterized protein BCR38DRAFT_182559 [Pseudomassariella vexata]|uniref:Uncharacterized protein n=1 Tax=Pseudomassariella vexata TaxID=1141098 RepID=A0A1Y2E4P5_9PEZI|nr:uncharacterized protein BCR38DRAFT_182559 [Pseudomassariella vexata]ORY66528.1 hypothetical protein BCR38DRAFT_182559 [Pseudomassariella vexata]